MSTPHDTLSPGHWAILASLTFASTLVFVFICISGVAGGPDRFVRFEAPGIQELELPSAGRYILYHEFDRTQDSQGEVRPGQIDHLTASLQSMPAGERVDLLPASDDAQGYVIRRVKGEPLYEFEIPNAGTWRLASEYVGIDEAEPVRLSIIPNPAGAAMRAFMRGLTFQIFAFAGIVALAYFFRWRNIKAHAAETA